MVDRCTGTTLGSQIEAPGFTYDMNLQENSLQLNITGLDIATVLETQQFEGLEATGELDGTLPVSLGPTGLSINGGQLQSRSAGTIRYRLDPDQAASVSNPLTDVVIDALSDFNYDVLAAEVNYDPAGDLFVGFRIEGSSPNFEKGRPVHLNINTEQNILSLLESLRYADNLNRQIDDKVRKNLE